MSVKNIVLGTAGTVGAFAALVLVMGTLEATQIVAQRKSTSYALQDLNNRLQTMDPNVIRQFATSNFPVTFAAWQWAGNAGIYTAQKADPAMIDAESSGRTCFQVSTIVTETSGINNLSVMTAMMNAQTKHDGDNVSVWCQRPEGGYSRAYTAYTARNG